MAGSLGIRKLRQVSLSLVRWESRHILPCSVGSMLWHHQCSRSLSLSPPLSISLNTWAGFQCVHLWASEVEFAATRTATFSGICGVGFLVLWCWWSNYTRSMIPWWPILQQWFQHPQNPAADLYAAPFRALTLYPRSPWRLRFANGPISDGRLVDLVSFVIISLDPNFWQFNLLSAAVARNWAAPLGLPMVRTWSFQWECSQLPDLRRLVVKRWWYPYFALIIWHWIGGRKLRNCELSCPTTW
jgi:hypothetical protein